MGSPSANVVAGTDVLQVVLNINRPKRRIWLQEGQSAVFGRSALVDYSFPDDRRMSQEHFSIKVFRNECLIEDLNSTNGTFVGAHRLTETLELVDGDVISAGRTKLEVAIAGISISVGGSTIPASIMEVPVESTKRHLIDYLSDYPEPLFAVLDAARDPLVLTTLLDSEAEYESLYSGLKGKKLAAFAPYLVSLRQQPELIERLITTGWGNSWGIFLASGEGFWDIRKHLRRYLIVRGPEGKRVYFRLYDPRVLRVFLPTNTKSQARHFFGPISTFICEADDERDAIRFPADHFGKKRFVRLD